jgi:serine/threonine protein kinase, bacterial
VNTPALLAGRYELRGRLGGGGMAEVRDGWDMRLNRPVAIKLLHPALNAQADMRNRFDAEARAAAALNHPNIVAVHDSGDHCGIPFIVMERLPGHTLADWIARGPLAPVHVRAVLDSVLAALTAAHRAAILHRDIKPGNILSGADGEVMKVADFGIAKTPGAAYTQTGQIVGTIAYLSPQRLTGEPACVADDLYAVGVVGCEALAALARAILHDRPPPLARLRPDVDPGLIAVIEGAMSPDVRQRPTSAEQMRAALQGRRNVGARGMGAAAPPRPATKVLDTPLVPRTPKRQRQVLAALALLAILIVIPLALALDPAPSSAPTEPTITSTPSPVPASNAVPPASLPTEQPPAPAPHGPGKGHGKGHGGDGGG